MELWIVWHVDGEFFVPYHKKRNRATSLPWLALSRSCVFSVSTSAAFLLNLPAFNS